MSELASALGLPRTFVFEGQELIVPAEDVETAALFEVWCEEEALRLIERHASKMSQSAYQSQLDGWRRDGVMGVYAFNGPFAGVARAGEAGGKEYAFLLLRKANPKVVDRKMIDRLFANPTAKADYMAAMMAASSPPNSPSPAAGQLAGQ